MRRKTSKSTAKPGFSQAILAPDLMSIPAVELAHFDALGISETRNLWKCGDSDLFQLLLTCSIFLCIKYENSNLDILRISSKETSLQCPFNCKPGRNSSADS